MDLDLRRLRYFVTVAEELSFIRAAQLLHMTQPALSRQISALERDLGTQLFERDRRGTALSPEESLERVALGAGVLVLPAGIADFYRRTDISYVPLQDVAARMVALAYNKHRTMPELEQFATLVAATLGMEPAPEPTR